MNSATERRIVSGPAGPIECAIDRPPAGAPVRGQALLCHPHPQHGGTMDNKVVQTMARALVQLGYRVVRFNFRGVGGSGGAWDQGRGEIDDALAVATAVFDVQGLAEPAAASGGSSLVVGGFSFGGFVAARAAARLAAAGRAVERLVLVAPAARNFALGEVPDGTLVVHGEADDVVPLAAVLDWARPQVLPVVVVPGVGHFFHGQLPLLRRIIADAWASAPSHS
ncbi:MAG: alpha/beta fold hydrolase [Rubrivivax sp.]|jgi:hypothetical protein|nr:alpha/beta fold hydrolase [Rubrivivax sp.]